MFSAEAGDSNVVTPPPAGASACRRPRGRRCTAAGARATLTTTSGRPTRARTCCPFDTTIYKTVTIEPCAEVLLAGGRQVTVRGKLIAEGTATRRIHIGAKDAASPFGNIRTLSPATIRLAYATLDGGGLPLATLPYLAGTLEINGDTLMPVQETLFVDHVTITGSKSNGLVAQGQRRLRRRLERARRHGRGRPPDEHLGAQRSAASRPALTPATPATRSSCR